MLAITPIIVAYNFSVEFDINSTFREWSKLIGLKTDTDNAVVVVKRFCNTSVQ
jgi:hypothetical protein